MTVGTPKGQKAILNPLWESLRGIDSVQGQPRITCGSKQGLPSSPTMSNRGQPADSISTCLDDLDARMTRCQAARCGTFGRICVKYMASA